MKKLSVIISFYNTEKFAEKCILSVINQTYDNLEIILIDDGSPDRCGEICDRYGKDDPRIKVIHQNNSGISKARNVGLAVSEGDYITFVDSDDYIEHDMYETMMSCAAEYEADIVQCGHIRHAASDNVPKSCAEDLIAESFSGEAFFALLYSEANRPNVLFTSLCNKIYRKSIFEKIRFPENRLYEDEAVIHKVFLNANCVVRINRIFYHYIIREGEIVKNMSVKPMQDKADALCERISFCRNHSQSSRVFEKEAAVAYYWFAIDSIQKIYLTGLEQTSEARAFVNQWLKNSREYYRFLRPHQKLSVLLMKTHLGCVERMLVNNAFIPFGRILNKI